MSTYTMRRRDAAVRAATIRASKIDQNRISGRKAAKSFRSEQLEPCQRGNVHWGHKPGKVERYA